MENNFTIREIAEAHFESQKHLNRLERLVYREISVLESYILNHFPSFSGDAILQSVRPPADETEGMSLLAFFRTVKDRYEKILKVLEAEEDQLLRRLSLFLSLQGEA